MQWKEMGQDSMVSDLSGEYANVGRPDLLCCVLQGHAQFYEK